MIYITNTLSKKKELFTPLLENTVGIYQCGPTVYSLQHIGNMRAVFVGDIVHRTFLMNNYTVNFVRNYTDVGHLSNDDEAGLDKMTKASEQEHISPLEIAQKYILQYNNDTKILHALPITHAPRATEYIDEMIQMTKELLEKGFAYTTPLAVYFNTSLVENYTKLSGQKLDEQKAGTGKGDIADSDKKNPADFALWFFRAGSHRNDLQFWPSPFISPLVENGIGFPGWHIECSAMARKILGKTIDIHMGGIEHIPLHHTNEIAQSECANESTFVNYWIHHEHLLIDNKKMAKSEGTSLTLEDIKEKGFSPLDLRFFFMQAHYRSKQNFTWEALEASKKGLSGIRKFVITYLRESTETKNETLLKNFREAISDDFNTPKALSVLFTAINESEKEPHKAIIANTT